MNILQICNKSPYPPKEGGPIAMHNLATGLMLQNHKVDILAMNTHKFHVDVDNLPVDYRHKTNFTTVYIDTRIKVMDAFLNLFTSKSYHVERFESLEFSETLQHLLKSKNFDIVQLETIYVAPYLATIRKYSNAKIVLRSHNMEHLIWNRFAQTTKNPIKRSYLFYLARKLENFEKEVFAQVDGIATITNVDTDYIKSLGITTPIVTVPFGLDFAKCMCKPTLTDTPSFFHLGSMDWMPNQEGIKWFLKDCMPEIAKRFPNNVVYLAGRNMPSWVSSFSFPNLNVVGEVDDASAFMNAKNIMFVPLLSGSGVRVKIIEGMALGKTIISTSIGAEGINYTAGKDILIANTPEEFVEKFQLCIENVDLCRSIGQNARKLIENEYDISATTKNLLTLYNQILIK